MFNNSKLKRKIKELEDRIKFLKEKNSALIDSMKKSTFTMKETIKKITNSNTEYKIIERNCAILSEMVYEADDTLVELFKITSTYHPMIIKGIATKNDIKTCSSIVQKSLVSYQKFDKLRILYNKVYNKPVIDLDIGNINNENI